MSEQAITVHVTKDMNDMNRTTPPGLRQAVRRARGCLFTIDRTKHVSILRDDLETIINALFSARWDEATPTPAPDAVAEAQEAIRDALMDSQYLAGAKAAWGAAQTDDPERAYSAVLASRDGHLAGFRKAKDLLALPASQPVADVSGDSLATAKARLSIAAVRARNSGRDRIDVETDDIAVLLAAHSDLDREVATLTARVEALEGAGKAVVDEFPAASGKYSDLEGADGKPGWGSIRRLSAALSPDPAVKPSEGEEG